MLLVSKNETTRRLGPFVCSVRHRRWMDGQLWTQEALDGAGRFFKHQLRRHSCWAHGGWGGPLDPVCSGCFPGVSLLTSNQSATPSPLSFSPSELLLLNSVALCPLPFLRVGTAPGQLNRRLFDDAGRQAGGRPPLASPREGSPATSPLLSSWGDLGLQKRGTWANAAASFHLG